VSEVITLRAYHERDLDTLIELFRTTVRTIARRDYTEAQVLAWAPDRIDRARWARRLADSETVIAEIAGTIAGFANLSDDGLVDLLFVHADQQRRGVASALLRHLEAHGRSLALPRLRTEASLTARPFFERRGFCLVAAQTVTLRGATLTNFRMEKVLA
jgi:putative acetyltransferase